MTTPIVPSISDEQLAELEDYYTSEPVPACRVCGAPLSISSIGGGRPTVWSCSDEEALIVDGKMDWDHYDKSQFEQRRTGDSRVISLIARLRAAEADAKRYRWLRDQHNELSGDCWVSVYSRDTCEWQSIDSNVLGIDREDDLDLDAAIDAAMERTP